MRGSGGSDAIHSIVGRPIDIDGTAREVVGVMPSDFTFPSSKTEAWIPLHIDPRNIVNYWAGDFMSVIGRLHDGSTLDQARADNPSVPATRVQDVSVDDARRVEPRRERDRAAQRVGG